MCSVMVVVIAEADRDRCSVGDEDSSLLTCCSCCTASPPVASSQARHKSRRKNKDKYGATDRRYSMAQVGRDLRRLPVTFAIST